MLAKWIGCGVTWAALTLWVAAALLVLAFVTHPAWRHAADGGDRAWVVGALVLGAWLLHVAIAFHVVASARFSRDDRRTIWRELWRGSYAHYRSVLRRAE